MCLKFPFTTTPHESYCEMVIITIWLELLSLTIFSLFVSALPLRHHQRVLKYPCDQMCSVTVVYVTYVLLVRIGPDLRPHTVMKLIYNKYAKILRNMKKSIEYKLNFCFQVVWWRALTVYAGEWDTNQLQILLFWCSSLSRYIILQISHPFNFMFLC